MPSFLNLYTMLRGHRVKTFGISETDQLITGGGGGGGSYKSVRVEWRGDIRGLAVYIQSAVKSSTLAYKLLSYSLRLTYVCNRKANHIVSKLSFSGNFTPHLLEGNG